MRKLFFLLLFLFFLSYNSYAQAANIQSGADYPVGKPNGENYYDAQDFGVKNATFGAYHLGEDWNGINSGDNDLNDPIYSISKGRVEFVGARKTWGNVVLIIYEINGTEVKALYAHLRRIDVKAGEEVDRGQQIGTMGKGDNNIFPSHLHFELRDNLSIGIGTGYGAYKPNGWLDPSAFIKANRPVPPPAPQKLAVVAASKNTAELSWGEATGKEFEKSELYRAEEKGSTFLEGKRTKIHESADLKALTFSDSGLLAGQNYFYSLATYYKDGQVAVSNEVTVNFQRETKNISNSPGIQRYVGISNGKVYWESVPREQESFPQKRTLYYYDTKTEEINTIVLGNAINKIRGPYKPQIGGDWLCYIGQKSNYGNSEIFCRNLAAGNMSTDIQITTFNGDDNDPQVSEEGIVTWQGGYNDAKRVYWTNLNGAPEVHGLTEVGGYQSQPRISGDNIIWIQQEAVGRQKDLHYKNIETGAGGLLVANIGDGTIDIWENNFVYPQNGKLYMASLTNPDVPTLIAEGGANARIRYGKIAYTKLNTQNGKFTIFVYMISSGKTITLAELLKYQPLPAIYENLVAYDASPTDSAQEMDIFLTSL